MEEAVDDFTCKHCNAYIAVLEAAPLHKCFKNKNIYMDNNNVLFTNDNVDDNNESHNTCHKTVCSSEMAGSSESFKQSAIWTDNATMALLSLYEANMHMLDHPKKKAKIWAAISNGLNDFGIEMSNDQIRWKMNSLQKKYKECCDNDKKSGRGKIDFKWYNQMDEIFGKNKDAIAAHTVSSQIREKNISQSVKLSSQENVTHCSSTSSSPTITDVPTSPSTGTSTVSVALMNKNTKATGHRQHGTGSNLANRKLNIEKQWLQFLEKKELRDTARDERHKKSEERATENFMLKKQIIPLKRKEIEQKKELLTKKLKDKENRHIDMMKIEKTKCKLLKKLLHQANIKDISDDSDE